jgi:predicted metal-dependent enzyme (double-stranded beta helix superfamily)
MVASPFTVESFAKEAKELIHAASSVEEQQTMVKALMARVFEENSVDTIVETLNAAVPPGANLAEMIIYADDDITLLWGQVPPRFQSAVHNHTIWANIQPIIGPEKNILYEEKAGGALKAMKEFVIEPGSILELAPDAIHCIENPSDQPARAFHVYGGNFKELDDRRDLWKWETGEKLSFSLPGVMQQSLARMAASENEPGLDAVAKAIPKLKPLVDKTKAAMHPNLVGEA